MHYHCVTAEGVCSVAGGCWQCLVRGPTFGEGSCGTIAVIHLVGNGVIKHSGLAATGGVSWHGVGGWLAYGGGKSDGNGLGGARAGGRAVLAGV